MKSQSVDSDTQSSLETFRVYHLTDLRTDGEQQELHNYEALSARRDLLKAARIFGAPTSTTCYVLVAEVRARDLAHVFCLTSHLSDTGQGWWENQAVNPMFQAEGCRSSCAGDIVVDNTGVAHFCDRYDWEEMGRIGEHHGSVMYTIPIEFVRAVVGRRLAAIVLPGVPGKSGQEILIKPSPG